MPTRQTKHWVNTLLEYDVDDRLIRREGYWSTAPVLQAGGANINVSDYGFFLDDNASETLSTIITGKNIRPGIGVIVNEVVYLIRWAIEEDASGTWMNWDAKLQYNLNEVGWNDVTGSSSVVQSAAAPVLTLADGGDTTQRISSFTFESPNEGYDEVDGTAGDAVTDPSSSGVEALFAFKVIDADVVTFDRIALRVVKASGTLFNNYDQIDPFITVRGISPGVGSAQGGAFRAVSPAIPAAADDGRSSTLTGYSNTGSIIQVGSLAASNQASSNMRFVVNLPSGVVKAARLRFFDVSGQAVVMRTEIDIEDVDDASQITSAAEFATAVANLSGLPITWDNLGNWDVNTNIESPDLTSLVQAVFDRSGWASGQHIQLLLTDDGSDTGATRNAEAFDAAGTQPPQLFIAIEGVLGVGQAVSSNILSGAGASSGAATTDGVGASISRAYGLSLSGAVDSVVDTIAANADDVSTTDIPTFGVSGNINMGLSGGDLFDGGYRFSSVAIPAGARISSAQIVFYISDNANGTPIYDVSFADEDDAAADTDRTSWLATPRTTSTSWTVTGGPGLGDYLFTSNLAASLQEVIDRGGWASGQAIYALVETAVATVEGHRVRVMDFSGGDVNTVARLLVKWSTVKAVGASIAIVSGDGASSGVATTSGVGARILSGDGAASGTATTSGVGASSQIASGDGAASGSATTTGVGAVILATDGAASGAATTAGVGRSIVAGDGASSGAATSAGEGASIAAADGDSSGTATTTGAGTAILSGDGAASGSATTSGVGASSLIQSGAGSVTAGAGGSLDLEPADADNVFHRGGDHTLFPGGTVIAVGNEDSSGQQGTLFDSSVLFSSLPIPKGAKIIASTIRFTCSFADSLGVVRSSVYAEAVDNPGSITDETDWHVRASQLSTEFTPWDNIPPWSVDESGPDTTTPDFSAVVQEIVNRSGWAKNNSFNVMWMNNGSDFGAGRARRAKGSGAGADLAQWHVEFDLVVGIGASIAAGAGASSGSATSAGEGASIAAADGDSSGAATTTGAGTAILKGAGAASGVATTDGVGSSLQVKEGAGASSGVATTVGVGRSTHGGAGVVLAGAVGSYEERIALTNDDGSHDDAHTMRSNVSVGLFSGIIFEAHFRFANVNIPPRAEILNAVLTGEVAQTDFDNDADYIWYGRADDDPGQIVIDADWHTVVPSELTTAFVNWFAIPGWTVGDDESSLDLSAIVQELVNRPTYGSGNHMAFIERVAGTSDEGALRIWKDGAVSGVRFDVTWDGVSGAGASIAAGAGASSGVATTAGVGAFSAIIEGDGASSGLATTAGVGALILSGAGASSGSATTAGVGESTREGAGSASGVATASGVGRSIAAAAGAASGVATASAVGSALTSGLVEGVGAASGVATVLGVGTGIIKIVGTASGIATVIGVGVGALPGFLEANVSAEPGLSAALSFTQALAADITTES